MVYKKYSYAHGVAGVPAQVAGEMMESIEERDGSVTPESFLEASRPEDSPTHGAFEWDDSIAAEKFRLSQSRHIINDIRVKIIREGDDAPKEKHIAFMNVTEGRHNKAEYKSMSIVMSNDDSREVVLKNAMQELTSFREKYRKLSELADVFKAIEDAERRFGA